MIVNLATKFHPQETVRSVDEMMRLNPKVICISHFGYRVDAMSYLKAFRVRVKIWEELSLEAVEEGIGLHGLFTKVQKCDPDIEELAASCLENKRSVYSSLAGFLGYAKWIKER